MIIFASIIFMVGCIMCIIGSIKHGKKNYDINVQLQPDIEQILKRAADDFMAKHYTPEKPCNHKWETIKTGKITKDGGATGFYYDLQCKNCGEITTRET